jgi:hypothetical protein
LNHFYIALGFQIFIFVTTDYKTKNANKMKTNLILLSLILVGAFSACNSSDDNGPSPDNIPTNVWRGATVSFTKPNNSDWTLASNQDRITDNVWITRQNNKGLFNIVLESSASAIGTACQAPEPSDTEWAYGSIDDISSLTFKTLGSLIGCNFQNIVDGQNIVLHLISDDIYISLKFTSWSANNGGGFGYERSTAN